MKQLTLMMMVPDRARADVMLKADRVFYGFATESSTEDGDLPGLGDDIDRVGQAVVDALQLREGETPISDAELRVNLYIGNRLLSRPQPSAQAIRRVADVLEAIDPVFEFIGRF